MIAIKKIIAKILISKFVYYTMIRFFNNNISFNGVLINTDSEIIPISSKGMLFWGFYESAECRMISKYVCSGDQVIELGASLGAVSCVISKIISKNGFCVSVEANPKLIPVIEANYTLNNVNNCKVLNVAIDYGESRFVEFYIDEDHLNSSLFKNETNSQIVKVKASKLKDLLVFEKRNDLVLICDIEGAEIGFLLNEENLSSYFKLVIVELHEVYQKNKMYTINDLKNLFISKHDFELLDHHGSVFVFVNSKFFNNGK